MKDLKDFIQVEINPIKVQFNNAGKNEFTDLTTIFLKCFNKKDHQNITLLMRNKYKRMMISNVSLFSKIISTENQPTKKELTDEEEVDSIIQTLSICDGDELISFYSKFKEFLISDIAYKDESLKQKLNPSELNLLDNDSLEKIIANYVAFFFVASWMK